MTPPESHSSALGPDECAKPVVLVIDDDDSVRRVTVKILERYQYRAVGVAAMEEALEVFDESVAAVILDWSLPGLSGVPAVESLLERRPDLCLVVVTGWSQDVEDALALRWSHVPVLHKPFEPDQLIEFLSQQGLSTA